MRLTEYPKDTIIELKEIIYKYPKIFMDINRSTPIEDTRYATDFVIKQPNRNVAVRVRDPDPQGRKFRDLTIRVKTKWDKKTEIDKIKEGYGDIYLYCWKDKNYKIKDYMIMDIHKLRSSNLLEKKRRIILNKDRRGVYDGTGFIHIKIDELNEFDCILENKIDGYKYQKQLSLFKKIGMFIFYWILGKIKN